MGKRIIHDTKVGGSNLNFTGQRQPVSPMPIPLRTMIRKWCHLNGVFMSPDGSYITIVETNEFEPTKKRTRNVVLRNGVKTLVENQETGKSEILRLYLNYHVDKEGREFVLASNARKQKSVNITGMMAIERQIQNLGFSQEVMDVLNANILCNEK